MSTGTDAGRSAIRSAGHSSVQADHSRLAFGHRADVEGELLLAVHAKQAVARQLVVGCDAAGAGSDGQAGSGRLQADCWPDCQLNQLAVKGQVAIKPGGQASGPVGNHIGFQGMPSPGRGNRTQGHSRSHGPTRPLGGPEQEGQFFKGQGCFRVLAHTLALDDRLAERQLPLSGQGRASIRQVDARAILLAGLLCGRWRQTTVLLCLRKIDLLPDQIHEKKPVRGKPLLAHFPSPSRFAKGPP